MPAVDAGVAVSRKAVEAQVWVAAAEGKENVYDWEVGDGGWVGGCGEVVVVDRSTDMLLLFWLALLVEAHHHQGASSVRNKRVISFNNNTQQSEIWKN